MAQGLAQPAVLSQPSDQRTVLALFVLCLLIPANFNIAGLNLSASRLYTLIVIIPFGLQWLSGRAGGIKPIDMLLLLHSIWIVAALVMNHGSPRFAYSGMLAVETFGGFLIGRMLIRSASDYVTLFKLLLAMLVLLLPFAFFELITDRAIMQELSRMVLGSGHSNVNHYPRMGLYRVQSVMQHPILFGVFCSITVANAYFIWSHSLPAGGIRAGLALTVTFTSLSSGALLASMLQLLLIGWGKVTGNAWKLLAIGVAVLYVFLSVASNRGPIVLMIETLTFNSGTGWTRIHIFNHGIDDALRNPIFGIGLKDWTRPSWLTPSVDNFWLLTAMRFGVVGWLLLAAGVIWHGYKIATAQNLTEYERKLRIGYMIGLVSLSLSLGTVHIWGPPYVLFLAYLGAGVWFYTRPETATAPGAAAAAQPEEGRRDKRGRAPTTRMRRTPAQAGAPSDKASEKAPDDTVGKTPVKKRDALKTGGAPKPARRPSPYGRSVQSGPKQRK